MAGQAFICTLKDPHAGLPKGTTIQVLSPTSSCNSNHIADALERQFGKKARDAGHKDYWDVKKM
jgi:hypothetical protein